MKAYKFKMLLRTDTLTPTGSTTDQDGVKFHPLRKFEIWHKRYLLDDLKYCAALYKFVVCVLSKLRYTTFHRTGLIHSQVTLWL